MKSEALKELEWTEIKSDTIGPDDYLEKYGYKPLIVKNFENYLPDSQIIKKIKTVLEEKKKVLKVLIIGAEWCADYSENVPKGVKIVKELNTTFIEMHIIYGVKTNPFRKKGDLYWHPRHSPPEAINPKFDLQKIPIFYFFNGEGKYLGRVVEKPRAGSRLEGDMLTIIEKKL